MESINADLFVFALWPFFFWCAAMPSLVQEYAPSLPCEAGPPLHGFFGMSKEKFPMGAIIIAWSRESCIQLEHHRILILAYRPDKQSLAKLRSLVSDWVVFELHMDQTRLRKRSSSMSENSRRYKQTAVHRILSHRSSSSDTDTPSFTQSSRPPSHAINQGTPYWNPGFLIN